MDTTKNKFYFSVFYKGANVEALPKACKDNGHKCIYVNAHSDLDECYGSIEVEADSLPVAKNLMEKWFRKDRDLVAYTASQKNAG